LFECVYNYLVSLAFESRQEEIAKKGLLGLYTDENIDAQYSRMLENELKLFANDRKYNEETRDLYARVLTHVKEIEMSNRIKKENRPSIKMLYFTVLFSTMDRKKNKTLEEAYRILEKADPIYFTEKKLDTLREKFKKADIRCFEVCNDLVKYVGEATRELIFVRENYSQNYLLMKQAFEMQMNKQREAYGLEPKEFSDHTMIKILRNCFVHNATKNSEIMIKKKAVEHTTFKFGMYEKNLDKSFDYEFTFPTPLIYDAFEMLIASNKLSDVRIENTDKGIQIVYANGTVEKLDEHQDKFLDHRQEQTKLDRFAYDVAYWLPPRNNSFRLLSHMVVIRNKINSFGVNQRNRDLYYDVKNEQGITNALGKTYVDALMSASCLFYILVNVNLNQVASRIANKAGLTKDEKDDLREVTRNLRNSIVHGIYFYDQYENPEEGGSLIFYSAAQDDFEDVNDEVLFDYRMTKSKQSEKQKSKAVELKPCAKISYQKFKKLPYLFADCLDDEKERNAVVGKMLECYRDFNQNTDVDDSTVGVGNSN